MGGNIGFQTQMGMRMNLKKLNKTKKKNKKLLTLKMYYYDENF